MIESKPLYSTQQCYVFRDLSICLYYVECEVSNDIEVGKVVSNYNNTCRVSARN